MRTIHCVFLAATILTQGGPKQPPEFSPNAVKASDLQARLDLVGRMPTKVNPTSPAVAGSHLLLIDQGGSIYRWDGTRAIELLSAANVPQGLRLAGPERIMNVAGNASGSKVYVMFISSTTPGGIPRHASPRQESGAWYVLYEYDFDGTALSRPRAIAALQVRTDGHTGGGMTTLADGSILFAPGDNGDSYEDGRDYSPNPSIHLAKILRIDPVSGSIAIAAVGVRNAQRLAVSGAGGDARVNFVDPGGWVAEELNSILVRDLIGKPTPVNFGWGRSSVDGKAREGTAYIDRLGNAVGKVRSAEPGFVEPVAEFGREQAVAVGISGPVSSTQSFSRIAFLFGDLVSGAVYAITGPPSATGQDVLKVSLVDGQSRPVTLSGLTAGARPDPRFFNFPDGAAGVLLERTGDFYRITEVR